MIRGLYDRIRLNFAIYPGVSRHQCAEFAEPYYAAMRERSGPVRIAFNALVYGGFWLWMGFRVRSVGSRWGWDAERRRAAKSLARRHFIDPADIALYNLTNAQQVAQVLRRFEHVGMARAISDPDVDHDPLIVDKHRFAQLAYENGIPHPVTSARLRNGKVEMLAEPPSRALFAKPTRGTGGKGTLALALPDDMALDRDAVRTWLAHQSSLSEGDWLVQQRILPHPDLAPLALDALPTIRMTLILDEDGAPEIVTSVLRLPSRKGVVADNLKQGGLVVPVDLESGVLGQARIGNGPGDAPHVWDAHPVTGAQIAGLRLSDWDKAKAMVTKVHAEHFPQHVQIGWDVALTDSGPMIIEPNARPGPRMPQRALMGGIGATRHGALLHHHLTRAAQHAGNRRFLTQG